ncbi:hypothetical protein [Methylobacterium sp. J-092]|uniref:hypothetical protein n=1 Tax=Methylobacterium sp. J-092 TaxID=2836667 RepID=UPI001FB8A4F3|nr:hypothetical protein [Methylobacterium sp. J-092]MCJ2005545.1 hypothetical protein [Methylobacterium sp. J-092]
MAQPPRPRPEATTPRDRLEERYGAAIRAADEAATAVTAASARHLAKLLRAGPEARFSALAESSSPLTPEDRGKLLQSLRGQSPPARPITAATASRLAIWRSRLPYRVGTVAMAGLTLVAGVGLVGLALHRTPTGAVTIAGREVLTIRWQLPDGSTRDGTLQPGQRYALMRWEGQSGRLRKWYPGHGYAEALIPQDYLQTAP